jgi:hypothetical protein
VGSSKYAYFSNTSNNITIYGKGVDRALHHRQKVEQLFCIIFDKFGIL